MNLTAIVFIAATFSFILIPQPTLAATVTAKSSVAQVTSNKSFSVIVSVNTQGKTVNNVEAVINFPANLLEVTSVSSAGSIFNLWVEGPSFSNAGGAVTINGGIPNPGYNGSAGKLVTINFKAKQSGTATVSFGSVSIRENDGFGTNIFSGESGTTLTITEPAAPSPETPTKPNTANPVTQPSEEAQSDHTKDGSAVDNAGNNTVNNTSSAISEKNITPLAWSRGLLVAVKILGLTLVIILLSILIVVTLIYGYKIIKFAAKTKW